MPPKRGKKGNRRGDDSSDDDADIDALDPLAHLRGGKQGNIKKGGDGEEGEEEKKKPLTKKEKRRIEEEQRRQRELEVTERERESLLNRLQRTLRHVSIPLVLEICRP